MAITPTGSLVTLDDGSRALVLARTFDSDIHDVWSSLTESDRTAKWFGPWSGEPGVGATIQLRMGFEDEAPAVDARIDACEAPRHLALSFVDSSGGWRLDLRLAEHAGVTTLVFTQPLDDPTAVESIGPGWEWYLDLLLASREGIPLPSFDDYYPAQAAYYAALV